jgi:hypothetical protein
LIKENGKGISLPTGYVGIILPRNRGQQFIIFMKPIRDSYGHKADC